MFLLGMQSKQTIKKVITLHKLKSWMAKKEKNTDLLITNIIRGIEEVKGQDIEILDLRELENTVTDYFIICNGTSNTQVNAIVNSVQKTVSKAIVLVFRAKQTSSPCAAGRADQTSTSVFVDVLSHVCNKSYKPPPFPATVPGTLPSPILELVGSDKVGFAVCSHCERKGCSGRRLSGWSRCPRVDFARVRTAGRLPGLVG